MNVNLHIERLILDGLAIESRQQSALQTAIKTELGRLFAQGDFPWALRGGAVPTLRANSIQLTSQSDLAPLGRQIAGSIYASIGKGV
jgi:hypothetical protein